MVGQLAISPLTFGARSGTCVRDASQAAIWHRVVLDVLRSCPRCLRQLEELSAVLLFGGPVVLKANLVQALAATGQ